VRLEAGVNAGWLLGHDPSWEYSEGAKVRQSALKLNSAAKHAMRTMVMIRNGATKTKVAEGRTISSAVLRAAASTCTSLEPVEPVPGFPSDQPLASGCFVELIVSNVIFDD